MEPQLHGFSDTGSHRIPRGIGCGIQCRVWYRVSIVGILWDPVCGIGCRVGSSGVWDPVRGIQCGIGCQKNDLATGVVRLEYQTGYFKNHFFDCVFDLKNI